ncbi:FMR1-interacting protein NUFIP2-like [Engystomops pustulosus]|uniref:FMR1-interacting protein NUFIP2-like n=1 Tax=Engystomops pustulosus TaxID=76066 RepID=UPI003AFB3D79
MHKEHRAQDENSNPRERAVSRRKERLSPSEHDMNHINRSRPKTGSWDSNGYGADIEALSGGRSEESAPLSPSNSLNLRHLRGCEKDSSGRGVQRPPASQYHPNYYPTHHHHHHRTSYSGHRKGYWDYESQYRDGKRKAWVPRPGGGPHPQRPRNREALNSTETPCADMRPEQDKGKALSRQPSPPADKELPATDSWLLFKPLPVFPVDSSSARTLPKISYASKVKENLDGKGLVPSSALRTSTTLPHCLLNTAPQGDGPTPHPGSLSSSSCSSLSSSSPPSPVSQDNLGAIFQNEWGLSFINEPGAGQAAPAEGRDHQEETPGGVEGGGDQDTATPVMVRLSHGFYIEGADPEATAMDNPRDWEAMVTYSLQEWNRVWNLHKKDPSRVVVYAETMDGKG